MLEFWFNWIILPLDSMLRLSTPLVLCALAGMFSERAGVVNIALEGMLLAAAFAAAAAAYVSGSAWIGMLAAIGATIALSMLHGFATITHRGNQIVSGMAINILVTGATVILGRYWFDQGGQTPNLQGDARFESINWWGAEKVMDIPIVGPIYGEVLSGHSIVLYLAFALVPLSWFILFRTRFGLRLRAVGENPAAVDTAGISVIKMRYLALVVCGILTGIAGSYLSTGGNVAQFIPNMSAGKGYIALAALIFGKWRPVPAMFGCFLFGLLEAYAIRLQGVEILGIGSIPVQFIEMVPYVLTVVLLAGFIGQSRAPKAVGIPYVKERE
ncbi:ABC transporter permease [Gynuella sunshinyii]|uniref:Putative ABC-type transport system, permease component n=1 Tax=Gynuella sunshinyii YC6258 TaxID=1445510 RepID=A0A0C5W536_9GAMM|nr:ABC transporter permease [Gynuella sunshinyii]AJQ97709.1 putative ABC-type transport system, permease component [Gynuella sunshinyii YC6258]